MLARSERAESRKQMLGPPLSKMRCGPLRRHTAPPASGPSPTPGYYSAFVLDPDRYRIDLIERA